MSKELEARLDRFRKEDSESEMVCSGFPISKNLESSGTIIVQSESRFDAMQREMEENALLKKPHLLKKLLLFLFP